MSTDGEMANRQRERKLWAAFHGKTPKCRSALKGLRECFKQYFPSGHATALNLTLANLAEAARNEKPFEHPYEYCDQVHPRAWDVILKHGKNYTPQSWAKNKPWEWEYQPLPRYCFKNSIEYILILRQQVPVSRATYVEGLCVGPLVEPMLHAWNGVGFSGKCYDWSFYATTMFNRYFGVPFTLEEYQYINQGRDLYTIRQMFRRDQFEEVEERVLAVLKKRPRTRLLSRAR